MWDSLITNFEIHNFSFMSVECDKPFAMTSCINILIWTINDINFVKMIT